MSKRNIRRIAAVAGVALAVGSAAPAMALRIGAGAGAGADVDPAALITDVTGSLPLPELGDLPIPSFSQVSLLVGGLGLGALGVLPATVAAANLPAVADNLNLDGILPESMDCGLVSVACGSTGPLVNASNINVLGGGILSNTGALDVTAVAGVLAPVTTTVTNVLNGSILGGTGGLIGGLSGILSVSGSANVGVLGLLSSL